LPIGPLGPQRWNHHCPMLTGAHQDWSFIESGPGWPAGYHRP
jgi:hypothetical protein